MAHVGRPPGKTYDSEFTIRIKSDVLEQIHEICRDEDISRSALVRGFIATGLKNREEDDNE